MGQALPCNCVENPFSDESSKAAQERIAALKKGKKFTRKALMGLTSQTLNVKLTSDTATLQWICESKWTKEERGEIDLTSQVKTVKIVGDSGMQIIGINDKSIIELIAEDSTLRDYWVVALNDLIQNWKDHPDTKPAASISADGASDKAEYFRKREEEILEREKQRNERKAKYAAGGMKYTAQAMANRS